MDDFDKCAVASQRQFFGNAFAQPTTAAAAAAVATRAAGMDAFGFDSQTPSMFYGGSSPCELHFPIFNFINL